MSSTAESDFSGGDLSKRPSTRDSPPYIHAMRIDEQPQEDPQSFFDRKPPILEDATSGHYLQSLVRRMQHASSKTVYHRLVEDWPGLSDDTSEVELEKQLWAFTTFYNANAAILHPTCALHRGGRVFELGSELGMIYPGHPTVNQRSHLSWQRMCITLPQCDPTPW